jgi:hypothetical protein
MKYSISIILFSSLLFAPPLVSIANDELKQSTHFVYVENNISEIYLVEYTKLVKGRYILNKKLTWYSRNIAQAIELKVQNANLKDRYAK